MSVAEPLLRHLPTTSYELLLATEQSILDAIPAAICVYSAEGAPVRLNRRALELFGFRPFRADGAVPSGMASHRAEGERVAVCGSPVELALRTGEPQRDREWMMVRPDGSRAIVSADVEVLKRATGEILGAIGTFQDISERKHAEKLLQDAEARIQGVLDVLPAAIYTTDAEGRITYVNRAAVELAGREPELGKDQWCVTWRLYDADGKPMPHDQCPMTVALKENREVRGVEIIAERPDGFRVPVAPYPTPLRDPDGRLIGAVNMLFDISARKISEMELRGQVIRLGLLNRIARMLSSDLDLDRIIQAVTDSATALSGAKFGAFFHATKNRANENSTFCSALDSPHAPCERLSALRRSPAFEATFGAAQIVRCDDIRTDERFARERACGDALNGFPRVVSCLAVPVVSRSGDVLGGLIFGHDQPGVFSQDSEEMVVSIAAHAAIAIDNARLWQVSQQEIALRRSVEASLAKRAEEQSALFEFSNKLYRAQSLEDVYESALRAIMRALRCDCASILLLDDAGVMRFVASRGLSEIYRKAVEGHSPWPSEATDPRPICIADIASADIDPSLKAVVQAEGIAALAFIPIVAHGALAGKFMAYYRDPHVFTEEETDLALSLARQLGFGKERMHGELAVQQLASIVRSSDDAIVSKDLDGIIVSWNRGAQQVFGYSAEEVIGKPITILIPTDRQDEEPRILERIRRGERVDHYETVRVRKDGTLLDISLTVSPMRDSSGKIVGASKIARDITERKHAEAQRELLVAELTHRVKNTLATVIAIAHQSSSHDSDDPDWRTFADRIRALAQTHTRLAEGNWSGVSLEAIVADETAPYRDGDNVTIKGPPVVLGAKAAISLGMAIHELATNAAKYGALSSRAGQLAVSWQLENEGKDIRLNWLESGGPPVEQPSRRGFGRLLLERALVSDLNAHVELTFARQGLKCEIAFPHEAYPARTSFEFATRRKEGFSPVS